MRLTCPSCKAMYEAPDAEIGVGRSVECSACGARWYQPGAGPEAGAAETGGAGSRMPGMAEASAQLRALRDDEDHRPVDEAAEPAPAEGRSLQAAAQEGELSAAPSNEAAAQEDLRASLRETMAEEGAGRGGAEAGRGRRAVDDIDIPPPPRADPDGGPQRRRAANIDAQSLTAQLRASEEEAETRSGAGFAVGFVLALLISAALAGAYLERERVAVMAPQFAPQLEAYVESVDDARRAVERAGDRIAAQVDPLIERARQALQGG